jgi:hypothetical protein
MSVVRPANGRVASAAAPAADPWTSIAGCLYWCYSTDATASGGLLVSQPDKIGTDFTPVVGKAAEVQSAPPQTWGKIGSALNFITMRTGNSGSAFSTASHTLVARRYSESGLGFEGLSATDDYTATVERVRINVTAAGNLNYARTHAGAATTTSFAAVVTTGQWNTVAISWNSASGAVEAYVNGSSVGSGTNTTSVNATTSQWLIGSGPVAASSGRGIGGAWAAYDSVLSAGDISTIHSAMAAVFA